MQREERKNETLKTIFAPLIVACCVGVGSSYFSNMLLINDTKVRIEFMNNDMAKIEKDVVDMGIVLRAVHENQIQLAKRGEWMKSIEKRIEYLETRGIVR